MFQTFSAQASERGQASRRASSAFEQASELIDRHPNLSETELALLINLYRELSALDMALMISDEQLGPKVDRFFADHRSKIRTPLRQYAALLGTAIFGILAITWALVFA